MEVVEGELRRRARQEETRELRASRGGDVHADDPHTPTPFSVSHTYPLHSSCPSQYNRHQRVSHLSCLLQSSQGVDDLFARADHLSSFVRSPGCLSQPDCSPFSPRRMSPSFSRMRLSSSTWSSISSGQRSRRASSRCESIRPPRRDPPVKTSPCTYRRSDHRRDYKTRPRSYLLLLRCPS